MIEESLCELKRTVFIAFFSAFSEPLVLKEHAKHFETGSEVPDDLLARLKAAKLFNEGFAVVEYTSCALFDMAVHSLSAYGDDFDLSKFEKEYLEEQGMPQGIVMRHRPAHFAHLFASSGYAAGYYVYQWCVTPSSCSLSACNSRLIDFLPLQHLSSLPGLKFSITMCLLHLRRQEIYLTLTPLKNAGSSFILLVILMHSKNFSNHSAGEILTSLTS